MDDTLHYLIMANQMLVQKSLLEQLKDTGLTIGQPKILDYLKDHDGSNQKEIARACFLEAGSLTTILNKMEEKGLIERRILNGNRRSFHIYLTAEGNRTLRLYVSEKEALEDLEHIRITNWINQHMKKLPSGSLKQLQLIIKCLENQDITIDDGMHIDNEVLINALGVYRAMNQIEQEPLSAVTEMALKELLEYRTQQNSGDQL